MLNLILIAGIAMLNYDGPAPGAVDLDALAAGFGDPSAWDTSALGDTSAWGDASAWGTAGQSGDAAGGSGGGGCTENDYATGYRDW